jgi:hypothetical protein
MVETFTEVLGSMPMDGYLCRFRLKEFPRGAEEANTVEGIILGRGPGTVNLTHAEFKHGRHLIHTLGDYSVEIDNVISGQYLE